MQTGTRSPQALREETSTFFTAPTNPVTGKENFLNNLVIMHLSDAKRPGATNPATIGKITLKSLLTAIKQTFNAHWYIDPDTNYLRIEHISFFPHLTYEAAPTTMDLSTQEFRDRMEGRRNFSHDTSDMVGVEGLEFPINQGVFDNMNQYENRAYAPEREFSSTFFSFGAQCIPLDSKGEKTERITSNGLFATDLQAVRVYPAGVPDNGWFIGNTTVINDEVVFKSEILPFSEKVAVNANFSASRLFKDFFRHGSSFGYGLLSALRQTDGRHLRAKSIRESKLFDTVYLPDCCDGEYNFGGFIKHPLQDKTIVKQLEFDLEDNGIEVTLIGKRAWQNIPIPDSDDEEDPAFECTPYGTLLRLEEEMVYCVDGITENYINIWEVYADGQCGEYRIGGVTKYLSDCSVLNQ